MNCHPNILTCTFVFCHQHLSAPGYQPMAKRYAVDCLLSRYHGTCEYNNYMYILHHHHHGVLSELPDRSTLAVLPRLENFVTG